MPSHSITHRQQFVRVCDCGCGQPTMVSNDTRADRGCVRGQPLRFVRGHKSTDTGGRYKDAHGYIVVRSPEHPHANCIGYVMEHRLVLERAIGRYLEPGEVVHHRNGVKDDNRLENLVVLTPAEHARLHFRENPPNLRPAGWSRHHAACVGCGGTIRQHHSRGMCVRCYMADKKARASITRAMTD